MGRVAGGIAQPEQGLCLLCIVGMTRGIKKDEVVEEKGVGGLKKRVKKEEEVMIRSRGGDGKYR